mmetsp:Transcript_94153/g.292884  ORF Transcript_94153/g.292884 Transcript_94153/m.292884 type:complete len:401 (+) Transcript_94153:68-1270(+)
MHSMNLCIWLATCLAAGLADVIPQFSIDVRSTLCAKPDFAALQGLPSKYHKAIKGMEVQAQKLANEMNCRLCDISGDAVGHGDKAKVRVECTASRKSSNTAAAEECLQGNGKVAWSKNDGNICKPCPDACETCELPGKTDVTYLTSRWFKCVLKTGSPPPQLPWRCEQPKDRSDHQGQKSWCRWRADLLHTASNGLSPSSSLSWELTLPMVRCGGVTLETSSNPVIAGIMQAVKPDLEKQWSRNCEYCRLTAGALASSDPSEFQLGGSSSKPWAEAKCAFDQIQHAACRSDRGPAGWTKDCTPCPFECATCEQESNFLGGRKQFKCALRPKAFAVGQLARLVNPKTTELDMVEQDIDIFDPTPATPAGYDCSPPQRRNCKSGDGFCMGFKTRCKFQTFDD